MEREVSDEKVTPLAGRPRCRGQDTVVWLVLIEQAVHIRHFVYRWIVAALMENGGSWEKGCIGAAPQRG
jgi:hypothetical protein